MSKVFHADYGGAFDRDVHGAHEQVLQVQVKCIAAPFEEEKSPHFRHEGIHSKLLLGKSLKWLHGVKSSDKDTDHHNRI